MVFDLKLLKVSRSCFAGQKVYSEHVSLKPKDYLKVFSALCYYICTHVALNIICYMQIPDPILPDLLMLSNPQTNSF